MNAYYLLTKRPLRAYELHKKWLVERLSRAPQSTASVGVPHARNGHLGLHSNEHGQHLLSSPGRGRRRRRGRSTSSGDTVATDAARTRGRTIAQCQSFGRRTRSRCSQDAPARRRRWPRLSMIMSSSAGRVSARWRYLVTAEVSF